MNHVGIIGQGRFGTLLASILANEYTVYTEDDVFNCETIFLAVPISAMEDVCQSIAPKLKNNTTIIDTCSVKVYPVKIMQECLPSHIDIIATHPLFGPDSYKTNPNKKIMLAKIRDQYQRYTHWKKYLANRSIEPVEMSPEQHDQYMAKSQGITHLIGRCLKAIDAQPTPINTRGYTELLNIMQHTCQDTPQLFNDLIHYNPYSQTENTKLLKALQTLLEN